MMTRPFVLFSVWKTIERAAHNHQIDIIHFTVEPYALVVSLLSKRLKKISVLTIHGNYGIRPLRWWASKWLARRMLQCLPKCIAVSTYTRDAVAKEVRNDKALHDAFIEKTQIISNGIPIRSVKEIRGDNPVHQILFVGGVKGSKGVMEAVRGCALYKEIYNAPFHFTIAGSAKGHSSYGEALQALIAQLNMQNDVSFPGRVSDQTLNDLYANADVFLMPSLTSEDTFEGFGLVYIEANAWGVPVIGPNSSGAAEAIADAESGYTVDPADAQGIAERLHWILDKKKISSEHCRAWAKRHDIQHMAEEIYKVYSLISSR